ncbi:hypothetical protein [Actinoplanes sp. NPDC049316]|uniref:hypothetical protein n=1 Tax=Actinoplanes sp. NPDC049316 TaxID=3154727 RepID=UPI0034343AE2
MISAVRYGTGTDPVEYIVIVDCGEGTPTHRYATLHLYVRPGEVKARDGEYDLTWQQARRSLADRAGLIPVPHVEVVVLSREPGVCDEMAAFVDGEPASPTGPPARVTGHVLLLDTDDEEHWWMVAARRGISHLSPAAQQRITDEITRIAAERGIDLDQLSEEYDQL